MLGALTVYVAVRDNEVVWLKVCRTCGKEKRVSGDRSSEFSPNTRLTDGSVQSWRSDFKVCHAAYQKARNAAADPVQARAHRNARHAERMKTDPQYAALRREQGRTAARAARRDEVRRRRMLEASRRYRARKKAEDPGFFSRTRTAERKEARPPEPRRIGVMPRFRAEPFVAWLERYREEYEIETHAALAFDLGIHEKRVSSLFLGQPFVAVDVVDTALLNARGGTTLDDLYPLEQAA